MVQLNIARALQLGFQAEAAYVEHDYNSAGLFAYQANQIHQNEVAEAVLEKIPYERFLVGKRLSGHTNMVISVAWSKDGRLASLAEDGQIIIWETATGKPIQTLESGKTYHNTINKLFESYNANCLAWSPDGRLTSLTDAGDILLWNLSTGQPEQTLKYPENISFLGATSLAWANDGRLATGDSEGHAVVWDMTTGQPVKVMKAYDNKITSLAWSEDGRLASIDSSGYVILWDLSTGQTSQVMITWGSGDLSLIRPDLFAGVKFVNPSVAWSPDGRLASTADHDNRVIIWDLSTGKPAQILKGHTNFAESLAWSSDNRLASGDWEGSVILWDLSTSKPAQVLTGHAERITGLSWSDEGLLASGSADSLVLLWDLAARQPVSSLTGHTDAVRALAWSKDGRLASASADKTVIVWNIFTGQPIQILKGHTGEVRSVAWSADGRLASGSDDNTVIIWNLSTGQPAQILKGHSSGVGGLAWSVDGQLASGACSQKDKVIIWDIATGMPRQIIAGAYVDCPTLSWSAKGTLAFDNYDEIILWDPVSGQRSLAKRHKVLGIDYANQVGWTTWLAGDRLTSFLRDTVWSTNTEQTFVSWDLATGNSSRILKVGQQPDGEAWAVAWSPGGQLALARSYAPNASYTITLWDPASGQPTQVLRSHAGQITSLAWSSEGYLASASSDGVIKLAKSEILGQPCQWINRNMTSDEWLKYEGTLYTYSPACPQLPGPKFDPLTDLLKANIQRLLITWQGRAILLIVLLVFMVVFFVTIWLFYKFATWARRKLRSRRSAAQK